MAAMAGLQLAGGYFAAENAKKTAQLNKEVAEMNAEFAELDAYDAEIEGYTQASRYQGVIDQTLGEQQLALTAADVDVNYGSAADIQAEARFTGELNKMEILKQAQERALGYKRQARDYRLGSALNTNQAKADAAVMLTQSITNAGLTGYKASTSAGITGSQAANKKG